MTNGARNLVTAAPTLPAPKMPSAVPCLPVGYQRDDIGDADRERAAGDADAERREQELRIGVRVGQEVGRDRRREHHHRVDAAAAVLVGPDAERSRRISEPVRIGVPTSRPNWVSLRPSSCLMRMPMIEKIVQTAKQTVKDNVESQSALPDDSGLGASEIGTERFMMFTPANEELRQK